MTCIYKIKDPTNLTCICHICTQMIFLEYSQSIIDKCRSQQLLCHQRVLIFKDITDGLLYKNLSVKVHQGITANDTYVIMLMLNTDGAPVFKSQNYSIWPLYASVLELAPEKR